MATRFDQYKEALERLPITNPTLEDLQSVCPHLTAAQVKAAFSLNDGETLVSVATPPLRVKHGYLCVEYWQGNDEPKLYFAYSGRTPASYTNEAREGDVFHIVPHQADAMIYAKQNWPDRLILDTWRCYGQFFVEDPTSLNEIGRPNRAFSVHWTLNRDFNEVCNDWSAPRSVLLDDAIIELTVNEFVGSELKGGRGGYGDFNCSFCGSGLGLSGCPGCGHSFRDDGVRSGWYTPLPAKVVKLLEENGHKFGLSPEKAWEKEYKQWAE